MDFATIVQTISTVGFPICMCLILMWYVKSITTDHKEETEKFTDALNRNTLVLQKLCDTIGVNRED